MNLLKKHIGLEISNNTIGGGQNTIAFVIVASMSFQNSNI
jgi:hypothetical protein